MNNQHVGRPRKFSFSVPDILERRRNGETYQDIATAFGCSLYTVRDFLTREVPDKSARTKPKHVDPRLAEILEARGRKESLEEIGERFGVTREYIRQIIAKADLDDNTRKSVTGLLKQRKPRPLPRLTTNIVNHWLSETGWRYCSAGKHVQPLSEFSSRTQMCRSCNRERAFKYRHEHAESFLAYARRYRQEHPEVSREAGKRYRQSHPAQMKEKLRQRYLKRKAANIRPADTSKSGGDS